MAAQQRPESTAVARQGSAAVAEPRERKGARELAALTTEKAKRLIEPLLPKGVTYERILSECYFAIQKNPKLMESTPDSLITAVAQCAAWDLEIGVKAHLVPFNVKVKVPDGQGGEKEEWQTRTQAIRDYKGDAELVVRCGAARYVDAHNVYENELFDYELGSAPFLKHRPIVDPAKRGRLIASYAVARVNMHDVKIIVLSREEIDDVRRKYSKSWKTHWVNRKEVEWTLEELPWYGPKTCVHRVVKLLPTNARLQKIITEMDAEGGGVIASGEAIEIAALGPTASDVTPRRMLAAPTEIGGYEMDTEGRDQPREPESVTPAQRTTAQRATAAAGASMRSPYDEGSGAGNPPTVGDAGQGSEGERPASSSGSSALATKAQIERLTYLLNDPHLDLADEERQRIAKVAGAKGYTAAQATEQIAQLERLQSNDPFGDEG